MSQHIDTQQNAMFKPATAKTITTPTSWGIQETATAREPLIISAILCGVQKQHEITF